MPKSLTKRSGAAFDVNDLRLERRASIDNRLQGLHEVIRQRATENLLADSVAEKDVRAFGCDFTIDLGTSSRFVAERVRDTMLAVPGRHYDFQLARGRDDFELECMRLETAPKKHRKRFTGPGFDIEEVFNFVLRTERATLEPKVRELLRRVKDEAFEELPDVQDSFEVEVQGSIAVARLAAKRLQRAQKSGWNVTLTRVYDTCQTFVFTPRHILPPQ